MKFTHIVVLILIASMGSVCGEGPPQTGIIKLRPDLKHQVISGWEATAQAGEHDSPAFDKYSEELFERAVNELGITRVRLELPAGAENPTDYYTLWRDGKIPYDLYREKRSEVVNDNSDPNAISKSGFQFSILDRTIKKVVIPLKEKLKTRGEDLFINLNYVGFRVKDSSLRYNTNPEEYAELILAAFLHMDEEYGFVPDAVEVILEPDNNTGWSAEQIARAVERTSEKLKASGFEPGFIVPNTTNASNAPKYIDEISRSEKAINAITEFGYHRYCCADTEVLQAIASRGASHGKTTAMLEYIGADYVMLHDDLKVARISAWQQYTIAFPKEPDNGAQYYLIDDSDPDQPVVKMGDRTRFLRLYFLYARPGARVIGAETTNPAFDPIAFVNTDGSISIVVKAAAPGTVTIEDPGAGDWFFQFASLHKGDGGGRASRDASGNLIVTVPGSGVLAVHRQSIGGKKQ